MRDRAIGSHTINIDHDFYAFEAFPRSELPFNLNRRQFFDMVVISAKALAEERGRGGAFDLAGLGSCPDDELAEIVPVVVPGCEISVHDHLVLAKPPGAAEPFEMFSVESPALVAFNRFNGQTFLVDAVPDVARYTRWEWEHSFSYVRGLFLTLVLVGVCAPKYYSK